MVMGRYIGTLHKICEGASNKKSGWNDVLSYLEVHSISDKEAHNPPFDSPLPPYSAPSDGLKKELLDRQGPRKEDTPLRIIMRTSAPSHIVAAMLHLCPETSQVPDSRGRLPLHLACRKPTLQSEDEMIIRLLVQAHARGIVHPDVDGRIPLHYLMWYHASTRSKPLVEYFVQPVPVAWLEDAESFGGQPPSAAMITDSRNGCLPLHYAIMEGASKEVIKTLLQAHPLSRSQTDKQGRTALSWYLGAGHGLHVSGEAPDPNAVPLYKQKRSNTILSLLLNSKSARLVDSKGRSALHWVCHLLGIHYFYKEENEVECLNLELIKSLLDHYVDALLLQDQNGMTPLHLLFGAATVEQDKAFLRIERNKTVRNGVDLRNGGGKGGFEPPTALIEILLKIPNETESNQPLQLDQLSKCAAHVEDDQGRLPLHLALLTAPSPELVSRIIQAHPTALLHTTEDMQTPVHSALAKPYSAPLQRPEIIQLLLQAYVTSRHGTFVNGKLALKMEDGHGFHPMHYACSHRACFRIIHDLLEAYPKSAKLANGNGDLPIHCLLNDKHLFDSESWSLCGGASLAVPMGWTSNAETEFALEQLKIQQELIYMMVQRMDRESMQVASSAHGMLPLHIVVAFDAVDYATIYGILDAFPEAATRLTTAAGHEYAAMDLHDMRQTKAMDDENTSVKWMDVRELLFAFGPHLNDHRTKEDLLEQCAKIVRDEAGGKGSVHATEYLLRLKKQQSDLPELEIKDTLSSIKLPEMDKGYKPRNPRKSGRHSKPSKTISTPTSKKYSPSKTRKEKARSIYDGDEFDHRYVVSEQNDMEDDDDYFDDDDFLHDEAYDTRDDPRYRNDNFDEEDDYTDEYSDDNPEDDGTWCTYDDDTKTTNDSSTRIGKGRDTTEDEKKNEMGDNGFEVEKAPEGEIEVPFFSDVAMRLWTFFITFCNPQDALDNYSNIVESILHKLSFPIVTDMINLELPPYGEQCFSAMTGKHSFINTARVTLENVAHNACKAAILKAGYFIGKYEFKPSSQDCLVMHRSNDGMTVYVRAIEHTITTEEFVQGREEEGTAEESIWVTGVAPTPVEDTIKSVFHVTSRKVCIKLLRSEQSYAREVHYREDLGVSVHCQENSKKYIVPLLDHFNAANSHSMRDEDVRYRFDLQDERFASLDLGGGETINPADFAFAVVLPFRDDGNLFDYFLHHGRLAKDEIREIGTQIGKALHTIHQNGLVHGNVSFSTITLVSPADESEECDSYWALTDLTGACNQSSSLMAGIQSTGAPNFMTSTFPPELFVKLNPPEAKIYEAYWEKIACKYGVDVDPSVVSPHVDQSTGDAYVLRCYFDPEGGEQEELPELPYKLMPARESVDIWAFGRVIYTLCSGGHPMFTTNVKTGHLLAYNQVAAFDEMIRRDYIYQHVKDPLAQDLLFKLLSSYEERSSLTMDTILDHPFFSLTELETENKEGSIERITEHRKQEAFAFTRSLQERNVKRAEDEWATSRSKNLHCWSLDFSVRMYVTPSTTIRDGIIGAPDIPFSLVILPYKFARNKSGKLTPSTKTDVERAERLGVQLIDLLKVCQFSCKIESIIEDPEHFDRQWTSTDLLEAMNLEGFEECSKLLTKLAATEVERFRDSPLTIARKIVQQCIVNLRESILSKPEAYLYLVDEFAGTPVLQSPYPCEICKKDDQVFLRLLPIMYMSVLYTCAVSGSIAGLVKLIFEAAYPHIPPSWSATTSSGINFELDKKSMSQQFCMLRESIAGLHDLHSNHSNQTIDDLKFLQNYLEQSDPRNSYANLKKITNGEAAMWTVNDEPIVELCKEHDIHSAYKLHKKQQEMIEQQNKRIAELEKALENAEFKRKHNLLDVDGK
mmetsp:Transcript_7045/g.11143  ORF Transcript_7045/g.11143 Transcript_7045/m.11143 type:complete len:1851 (-) Transcript_7045:356-5908(-)